MADRERKGSLRYSAAYRQLPWEERFRQSYLPQDGPLEDPCWIWQSHRSGHRDPKFRYGTLVVNKKRVLAHRLSWELATGTPPDPHVVVCHRCDVPLCVNPNHLFVGSRRKNNRDRNEKRRHAFGSRHGKYRHGHHVDKPRWRCRPDGSRYFFVGNSVERKG